MKSALVILALLILEGCAALVLVKDCNKVADDSGRYVCRQVKPWE